MIFIGLGGNLPSRAGSARDTLTAALADLAAAGVRTVARSGFWETAPVPVSDQPWFVNAVAAVETDLEPAALLALMHRIEANYGRERLALNGARTLDLDLLAYHDRVNPGPDSPILPHPRVHLRAFTLRPLAELAPDWVHPASGEPIGRLLAALDPAQEARLLKP
ncbi:MAG TPA: 2-amino-4-hydroxy-6-hydroxymethyldihydropteridine diphosphokinase [Alphaproteobacteria bacterium]|nr:2-amino-4-hydroxy-6-hydroxymethyldihydropteridine diphosphokinase [Alphaproteobacteria bacterium]